MIGGVGSPHRSSSAASRWRSRARSPTLDRVQALSVPEPARHTAEVSAPGTVDAVLARQLVFVTGKGGVGKTTVAAAFALAAADGGRRSLLCELGGQARVARAFGQARPPAHAEVPLAPALASVSIDPDVALGEWLARNLGRTAAALLGRSGAFDHLVAAAPGARELVAIGKAWDLTRADPGRLVVLDAPASGHAIALLQAPGTFSRLGPSGPIGDQAGAVRAFFADPARSAIVLVCTPEELPVNETVELAAAVEATTGRGVDLVVVDEVLPDRFDAAEVEVVQRALGASPNPGLRAAGAVVRRAWSRARAQEEQRANLRASVAVPIVELPFLFVAALGPAELRALVRRLAAGR